MKIGDRVRKATGDYQHTGTIVSVFEKRDGSTRVVVEFDPPVSGMLHIFRPEQLETTPREPRIESLRRLFPGCVLLFPAEGDRFAVFGDDVWRVVSPGSEIQYHHELGYATRIDSHDLPRLRLAGIAFKVIGGEDQ